MIPVTQTKRGGPDVPPDERGDCFDACIASVLEVPLEAVPCPHVDDWWASAQAAVARHGYRIVYFGPRFCTLLEQAHELFGHLDWPSYDVRVLAREPELIREPCGECEGGELDDEDCPSCGGSGEIDDEMRYETADEVGFRSDPIPHYNRGRTHLAPRGDS